MALEIPICLGLSGLVFLLFEQPNSLKPDKNPNQNGVPIPDSDPEIFIVQKPKEVRPKGRQKVELQ